jgi:iron(III) transport system ATP-binding protein
MRVSYHSSPDDARDARMSLAMRDIEVRFGAVAAVVSASLAVEAGEIVVLFGPSGCGKTTLLRAAAGLERPRGGTIELGGRIVSAPGSFVAPEKREIGFVFQDYVLFPHMSVLENIRFGLNALPTEEQRRRADAELAACGIKDLAARFPHQLSGGQQQRAALARALARRPKAMLLDEPFAAIDAGTRARLRDDVRRVLKSAGAATVLVTHDADEALAMGDRIAIMKEGRIIETAGPRDLFERPKTVEGALLFSGAQRFAATVKRGDIASPFGPIDARGLPDGPAVIALMPGALRVEPRAGGAFTGVDSRFIGPHWRIELAVGELRLFAIADRAFAPGEPLNAAAEPNLVRIFPLDANANELHIGASQLGRSHETGTFDPFAPV